MTAWSTRILVLELLVLVLVVLLVVLDVEVVPGDAERRTPFRVQMEHQNTALAWKSDVFLRKNRWKLPIHPWMINILKKHVVVGCFFANFLDTPWFNTDSETKCSQKPGEILLSHGGGWPRPYQWCLLVSTIQLSSHIIPTIHPTVSLVMYCLDVLWIWQLDMI